MTSETSSSEMIRAMTHDPSVKRSLRARPGGLKINPNYPSQPGVDAENPQRLATGIEILMPLKNRNREHVERVKVEFLIFDDNLSLAADDKIDLVVQMTMRS